jgi:hypothetical protein
MTSLISPCSRQKDQSWTLIGDSCGQLKKDCGLQCEVSERKAPRASGGERILYVVLSPVRRAAEWRCQTAGARGWIFDRGPARNFARERVQPSLHSPSRAAEPVVSGDKGPDRTLGAAPITSFARGRGNGPRFDLLGCRTSRTRIPHLRRLMHPNTRARSAPPP